jgi:hypothetical protein
MNLELPADARVLIVISPDGGAGFPNAMPLPGALPVPGPRRPLLKGAALLILVGGAYLLGGHSVQRAGALQAQSNGTRLPADDRAPTRFPEVPPAFAQQLQQPSRVTPPPGAAPSGPPAKSAFGLEE